ncbi:nucleotidyl transferase AbiEii/AbiGii toxin family protein [Gammaproteobacteria bacterium AH-315-E17]|nr:nucleotidyl transferase AbiEii/AbiGii toxin family protein [Gammaproteobacteria bacterium AH-315-E17]
MNKVYRKQVQLLLDVLPEVAKETCFALHGGTAINMFVRDMPRLSVDIDLTYVPIEERAMSLENINQALDRIKAKFEAIKPDVQIKHQKNICKLLISSSGAQIKIELNMVGRGTLSPPVKTQLCQHTQNEFDAFCSMPLVPISQLYGGKICAALDRQHPRDLFDVKLLMENEGFTDEIKQGFLYGLLSGDRPMHELLDPHLLDQRAAFENQFEGMAREPFTYDDYQETRDNLIQEVNEALTEEDKAFLLGVKTLKPDWAVYPFERFPSVKWKLLNLEKLKRTNPKKHFQQHQQLRNVLKY